MRRFWLLVCFLLLFGCARGGGDGDYDDSDTDPYIEPVTLTGITIDWSTLVREADGSDNWPITWSDDGEQYGAYGDGWGFSETGTKKSLGFSRISGDYDNQTYQDLWAGNGKCYGIISINGAFYAWVGEPGSGTDAWEETTLYLSTDKGLNWAKNSWCFTKEDRIFALTFMQAGQDYADAPDNYVYIFSPYMQYHEWEVQIPGYIMLMRVLKDQVMVRSAYEFFAGSHWSNDIKDMSPCLADDHGVFQLSVSYFADLNKYILATEHTSFGNGNLALYQADSPWGPYNCFVRETGYGGDTFFWVFSQKWSSGYEFAMIYTGINKQDAFQCIKGRFLTE